MFRMGPHSPEGWQQGQNFTARRKDFLLGPLGYPHSLDLPCSSTCRSLPDSFSALFSTNQS